MLHHNTLEYENKFFQQEKYEANKRIANPSVASCH